MKAPRGPSGQVPRQKIYSPRFRERLPPMLPADQMTQDQIKAFANVARRHNVRVLLKNGLTISPDGTIEK